MSRHTRTVMPPRRRALVTFALIGVSAALLLLAWAGLEADFGPTIAVLEIVALAVVPALLVSGFRRWWVGAGCLSLGLVPASGIAFGVSLVDMRPGSRDFFGPVVAAAGAGLRDAYETDAPFVRAEHRELAGLVLLGLYVSLALTGLLLACRRPLPAGLVLVIGVAVPVTVAASYGAGNPLAAGGLVLATILLALFLLRSDRRPLQGLGPAIALGSVLVLTALGASAWGAVAKNALIAWTRWDLYDEPKPVGVRYVWNSNYRGITFPDKKTVVLRIKAPKRSLYWRATTLDEYTGLGWREDLWEGSTSATDEDGVVEVTDPLLPAGARDRSEWTRQEVTVVALADTRLIAASQPVRWAPGGQAPVTYASGGIALKAGELKLGQSYTVWSYTPDAGPDVLAREPARYPPTLGRFLEIVPGVRVPAFGSSGRDAVVDGILESAASGSLLARYDLLYDEAQRVVRGAANPYIVAATLEAYLRSEGGFRYEEQPEQPLDETPPLVDFVLRTKEGYCQQFAGSMAVMLRLLGVPARVAVGFRSGKYDEQRGEWIVTDHDAHAWVEVWFPRYGWLPFDPTPGRAALSGSYSTSSTTFPAGSTALGIEPNQLSTILRQRIEGRPPSGLPTDPASGTALPAQDASRDGSISIAALVVVAIGAAFAFLLCVKALRRQVRYLSRDPRRIATACRQHLIAFLADQRISVDESTTLRELGAYIEKTYRVDPAPFIQAATLARFGRPNAARTGHARHELRRLLHQLRRQLKTSSRVRGALSFRSIRV